MVGSDRAGRRLARGSQPFAIARHAGGALFAADELVAEPLHLLFLAVHHPEVVAEEQVQVLLFAARQPLFDGLELEQQVVAKCAHQTQPAVFFAAELLDQGAQNGEHRRLLAALFLGEQAWQRFQAPHQAVARETELFPMRMPRQHGFEHPRQHLRPVRSAAAIPPGGRKPRSRAAGIPKRYPSASTAPDIRIRKKGRSRDGDRARAERAGGPCGSCPSKPGALLQSRGEWCSFVAASDLA